MRKEALLFIGGIVGAIEVSKYVFSQSQKKAIRDRDQHKCNFPGEHVCNQNHRCEIHHILPQSYCYEFGIDPDYAENALNICENAHKLIHPDIENAKKHYVPKGDSFLKVQKKHTELSRNRKPYWNTKYDRAMAAVAVRNTQEARREHGWELPQKNEQYEPMNISFARQRQYQKDQDELERLRAELRKMQGERSAGD